MKIKSRKRRVFRLSLFVFLAGYFLIRWIQKSDNDYWIISAFLLLFPLIELLTYSQTVLELTQSHLIVQRKGLVKESYEIDLNHIQSSFYDKKTYDLWELYHRFFIELFFPSGQSVLIVNLTNGKSKKIPFNGKENDVLRLIEKLPEQLPN